MFLVSFGVLTRALHVSLIFSFIVPYLSQPCPPLAPLILVLFPRLLAPTDASCPGRSRLFRKQDRSGIHLAADAASSFTAGITAAP